MDNHCRLPWSDIFSNHCIPYMGLGMVWCDSIYHGKSWKDIIKKGIVMVHHVYERWCIGLPWSFTIIMVILTDIYTMINHQHALIYKGHKLGPLLCHGKLSCDCLPLFASFYHDGKLPCDFWLDTVPFYHHGKSPCNLLTVYFVHFSTIVNYHVICLPGYSLFVPFYHHGKLPWNTFDWITFSPFYHHGELPSNTFDLALFAQFCHHGKLPCDALIG